MNLIINILSLIAVAICFINTNQNFEQNKFLQREIDTVYNILQDVKKQNIVYEAQIERLRDNLNAHIKYE